MSRILKNRGPNLRIVKDRDAPESGHMRSSELFYSLTQSTEEIFVAAHPVYRLFKRVI